ncbi:HAD family hydrolase [Wenzhouxiangella sp. AB-CW3]|uniref:sulfotransferase-like domain-containing protein n=1 Tax=Wenzhouxiangella sp. AB-CW3 TaxID=2771012 RepID=UPI00168B4C47|nr:HAD family hydrolase [Wenzhouxiangella sp. AB-CW3]QOC21474.1 HAD family hydrolase [Wenzhouxiangella sp. AB-CW3]
MSEPLRIAMWSGPRNISTAMMRAWENRPDCHVSDEPLYAAWLSLSGADHPGRDEVIAAGNTDWRRVVADLTRGLVPDGSAIWYQKHMCHHLHQSMDWTWIGELTNILLIRRPDEVVASYVKARGTEDVGPEDVGLPQQVRLFEWLRTQAGQAPPVIDSGEFLARPEEHLRMLCDWLGIDFLPAMLSWPAGPRETDGVWARYWYDSVWRSTGFSSGGSRRVSLSGHPQRVAEQCWPLYEQLREQRLRGKS